jgi:hypothetical protein
VKSTVQAHSESADEPATAAQEGTPSAGEAANAAEATWHTMVDTTPR